MLLPRSAKESARAMGSRLPGAAEGCSRAGLLSPARPRLSRQRVLRARGAAGSASPAPLPIAAAPATSVPFKAFPQRVGDVSSRYCG